jgi:hypothetical protein
MAQLRVASHKCLGTCLKIYDRLHTYGSPCEHDNDPSGSLKYIEFLDCLRNYELLKNDPASWSYFVTFIDKKHDIYLTAVGLTPGGSSTSHIYTQTVRIIQR